MTLHFPSELLLIIFNFAVHTSYEPADQPDSPSFDMSVSSALADIWDGLTGIRKDAEYPESQIQPGVIAHTTNPFTPLHISHVCKDWRDIAFSASELWTSIYVADGMASTPHLLRLWLRNSRSQPLDIVFRDTPNGSSGDTILEMIEMAAKHSVRWRTFKVRLGRHRLPMVEVKKALHGIVTPRVQTLAFSFNPTELGDTQFDDLWTSLIANAPKLQELQMWSTKYSEDFVSAMPFDRLTCITLVMVCFEGGTLFWQALRGCNVLRTLAISFSLSPGDLPWLFTQPPSSSAAVSIPSLRHLRLIGASDLCVLLLGLHLPSLSYLTMHTHHTHLRYMRRLTTDVYIALEDFLTRSQCRLLSFKIRDEREGGFEMRVSPILRHFALRDLVELRLGSAVGKKTLGLLVRRQTGGSHLQFLKHIELDALVAGDGIPFAGLVAGMAASRSCDSRPAANLAFLAVGFLSRTQLILEMRAWNDYIAEEGDLKVEKVFYYASGAELVLNALGD